MRTPLLPINDWLDWSHGLYSIADKKSLAHDRKLLRKRLYNFLLRAEVKEALFIATPQLYERLRDWHKQPDNERGQKIEQTLVRYFARMTSRPTPFGLFAGYSLGKIDTETRLFVPPRSDLQRHTRLDAEYLFSLIETLTKDSQLQEELIYRPNSSLYNAFGHTRYVKEIRLENKNRSYHLAALNNSEYLLKTLNSAKEGAQIKKLATALVSETITYEQARKYITDLIAEQILVSDLQLAITGIESIRQLIVKLQSYKNTRTTAEVLSAVCRELEMLDRDGIGAFPMRYHAIADRLTTLPAQVEMARLFQVDLIKSISDVTLGEQIINETQIAIRLFHRHTKKTMPTVLKRFIERFISRYEEREILLLEALDEESGIGFDASIEPSSLLKNFPFLAQSSDRSDGFGPFQIFLLNKLSDIWRRGLTELILDERELEKFAEATPAPLPDAFVVNITLTTSNPDALSHGDFQIIWHGALGPSGARLFGRFCQADPILRKYVKDHLRAEEAHQPDAVWAEIVHLPAGRMGNILSRPVLRDYEIVYLGGSGTKQEKQISVNDLLVSIRNGRILLRSKKLGCRVIPRLTNAHNYGELGLGVYRFLCLLQNQDTLNTLVWQWGVLGEASFLPRLRVGRLILALAQWQISKEELENFSRKKDAELFRAIQKWRKKRRIPRLVTLADGDNVLPIDLDNILSIESFVQLVNNRERITLKEYFPTPEQLCVTNSEGMFTHEIAVPFVKNSSRKVTPAAKQPQIFAEAQHSFPPGSEWLYVKFYAGTATVDKLLINVVRKLINELKRQNAIDKWFFIRFGDPDWHLRLRFFGEASRLHKEVHPLLEDAIQNWLERGALWRIQYDTYKRETERYGGTLGIDLTEQFFHADSEAVLKIIERLEGGDAGLDERWRLTCAGMDLLLNDFGLSLAEKYELLRDIRDSFAREYKVDKQFRIQLGEKYRQERKFLTELLKYPEHHPLSLGLEIFRERSCVTAPIIKKLYSAAGKGKLSSSINKIIGHYLHMHANRLLRSMQKEQEVVIYDLLTRHYYSLMARNATTG